MTTGPILAAILATIAVGAGLIRAWLTRRRIAGLERDRDGARAELEATAAERDRAQLQEAATRDHADGQARGHEAAGEITTHATGHPDADRAALYDRMRDTARDRRAGPGAGGDAAVRPVPGAAATRGDGRGD